MKLLLDSCVWGKTVDELRNNDLSVEWVGLRATDPGDDEILREAHESDCILVTLDKDFGELAVRLKMPHSGIIRLVGIAAREQAGVCLKVLRQYSKELQDGALITVDQNRIRIRKA